MFCPLFFMVCNWVCHLFLWWICDDPSFQFMNFLLFVTFLFLILLQYLETAGTIPGEVYLIYKSLCGDLYIWRTRSIPVCHYYWEIMCVICTEEKLALGLVVFLHCPYKCVNITLNWPFWFPSTSQPNHCLPFVLLSQSLTHTPFQTMVSIIGRVILHMAFLTSFNSTSLVMPVWLASELVRWGWY